VDEPEQAPPWRPEMGPPPERWVWPPKDPPALWVRIDGRWCNATVLARDVYADGRVAYRVVVSLRAPYAGTTERMYWWPQEGLRVAHRGSGRPERA